MFKRGVSAKDLRPFSVADPLGQKRGPVSSSVDPLARYHSTHSERTPPPGDAAGPAAAAKVARLGCLVIVAVWAMGLVTSAAAWLPRLIDEVRPAIVELMAKWEKAQGASGPEEPADDALAPLPVPGLVDAPPDPTAPPASPPGNAAPADLARACESTVSCCLTVQGERARSICENFRQMPVVEPCLQAYEAFAQVGSQLGRPCQQ